MGHPTITLSLDIAPEDCDDNIIEGWLLNLYFKTKYDTVLGFIVVQDHERGRFEIDMREVECLHCSALPTRRDI